MRTDIAHTTRPKKLDDYDDVLTVQQAQEILQIGRNTLYRLIQCGKLPHIRIGRCIRIPKARLIDYLNQAGYNDNDSHAAINKDGDI